MTGRFIRSTFITDQSEFIENSQIGKQIGKLLDMPKGTQAQKHICWVFGHLKIQKVDLFDYVRNEAILVLVFYFVFKKNEFLIFLGEN